MKRVVSGMGKRNTHETKREQNGNRAKLKSEKNISMQNVQKCFRLPLFPGF